eukprot:362231-Chlamydomonas_euryale.AAC.10
MRRRYQFASRRCQKSDAEQTREASTCPVMPPCPTPPPVVWKRCLSMQVWYCPVGQPCCRLVTGYVTCTGDAQKARPFADVFPSKCVQASMITACTIIRVTANSMV